MKLTGWLFLTILFCNSCSNPKTVNREIPLCDQACDYARQLPGQDGQMGCLEARSFWTPEGYLISCEEFCQESQQHGKNLQPSCWLKAHSCQEIETLRSSGQICK